MKKLLVLMLVLGMATLASAGLQISVGGLLDVAESEITIAPSDVLVLDVHTNTTLPYTGTYLMMAVEAAEGTLSGGAPTQGGTSLPLNYYALTFAYYAGATDYYNTNPVLSAVAGVVSDTSATTTFDGKIYDLIDFHCEAIGDATISLYSSPGGAVWTLEDTLIVHQIPEPITMVLLGLGGLFLRRRK